MAPIQFGVLQIPYQVLDVVGPLDVLSSSSKPYLKALEPLGVPAEVADRGIDIEFHYVGLTMEPQTHTAGYSVNPSTTVDTCPRLDYLLIGGPSPDVIQSLDKRYVEFMRERALEVKIFFTTCTGGMVAGVTGLLDGRNATTFHAAVPLAQQFCPNVKWTRDTQWVIDGKFWTAGGAFAGTDMFAHWVMENYGKDVAETGFMALDFEPRDVNGKRVPLKRHMQNGAV